MKFDLIDYILRQQAFSERAFGPGDRAHGVLDHIQKEIYEVKQDPRDLKEWVDIVTLALDGAWRAGHSPEAICEQLNRTLKRNEHRNWPDWRTADPNKAIEHIR